MTDGSKDPPLYQAICDEYRRRIEGGELRPGDPMPSEAQMALRHGVSNITARRALNELKRQGLVVRERGRGSFVSSLPQRPLADMDRVMLLYPLDSEFTKAAEFIATLFAELERRGCYLSVHFTNDNPVREAELLEQALEQQVAGVVLYPVSSHGSAALLLRLRQAGIPVVLADRGHLVPGFPTAASDNVAGGRMMTEFLLSRGYDRILFVSNHPLAHATSLRDRYHGYIDALLRSGRSVRDAAYVLVDDGAGFDTPAHGDLIQLLRSAREPIALMCASDPVAIFALNLMRAHGLTAPEHAAVTGFDNLMLAARTDPPLTTVDQNYAALARACSQLLVSAMEQGGSAQEMLVPVALTVRASTR